MEISKDTLKEQDITVIKAPVQDTGTRRGKFEF
jgi:hypothetical protein